MGHVRNKGGGESRVLCVHTLSRSFKYVTFCYNCSVMLWGLPFSSQPAIFTVSLSLVYTEKLGNDGMWFRVVPRVSWVFWSSNAVYSFKLDIGTLFFNSLDMNVLRVFSDPSRLSGFSVSTVSER